MALTQPSGRAEQKIRCAGVVVFRVNEGFTGHAERAHREGAAALVRALQCEGRPEQGKAGPNSRQELHACAGVRGGLAGWGLGSRARPIRSCIRARPRMWLHSRAQGPRPAAGAARRRVAPPGCALLTCLRDSLSEHFPRNRGTRRRYSLHRLHRVHARYAVQRLRRFVRFFARLGPRACRASRAAVGAWPQPS